MTGPAHLRNSFRPWCSGFLTAHWRNPTLLSWPISDDALESLVPAGVEIDHWRGDAYISLVGLWFTNVRVLGIPAPLRKYAEVNLRFYVRRRKDSNDENRGVVFIRQMVPHRATALVARRLFGEPFLTAKMRYQFEAADTDAPEVGRRVAYGWRHGGRWHGFWAETDGAEQYAEPGSLAEFLTARYWGYNGGPRIRTRMYRLSRQPWTLSHATGWGLDCDIGLLYGRRFSDAMSGHPTSALMASDSWARIHLPCRLVE